MMSFLEDVEESDILLEERVEFKPGILRIRDCEDDEENLTQSQGHATSGNGEDSRLFFSSRSGLMEKAMEEIEEWVITSNDGNILGHWLLTEISLWDVEKERIVVLTQYYVHIVKYDFIALKVLDHYSVRLRDVDTVAVGDLVYPTGSVAPPRNQSGIRIMWNKGQPLKFVERWNPLVSRVPWATLTSHPLLWHKEAGEEEKRIYDVESFASRFIKTVQMPPRKQLCSILSQPLLCQNYFGVLSVIHNRTGLGFFKVRGKFSF